MTSETEDILYDFDLRLEDLYKEARELRDALPEGSVKAYVGFLCNELESTSLAATDCVVEFSLAKAEAGE